MKYKISFSGDRTYIRIKVFEVITGDIEKVFAENAIKSAKQKKINKFLVDVRGTSNRASLSEQYYFGHKDVILFGLNRNSRIAILVDLNDKSHNFIETVLRNAGYNCRIFFNEDAVVKWFGK